MLAIVYKHLYRLEVRVWKKHANIAFSTHKMYGAPQKTNGYTIYGNNRVSPREA